MTLGAKGLSLQQGRVFVQGALGARTEIDLGGATAIISGANAGIDRSASPEGAHVYVATAEITMRAAAGEQTVRAGETATVAAGKVTVAPERGYDDWTYGMATPWGARGTPRRAVGELWGRPSTATAGADAAGSPLTIRAHDVRATVTREVAETEVRTTFFNAGSETVVGDYRMAVPPGAIVSRFATARGERTTEGKIALAARKQVAAFGASEVLEWAGEGWLRATVPSIAPGATWPTPTRQVNAALSYLQTGSCPATAAQPQRLRRTIRAPLGLAAHHLAADDQHPLVTPGDGGQVGLGHDGAPPVVGECLDDDVAVGVVGPHPEDLTAAHAIEGFEDGVAMGVDEGVDVGGGPGHPGGRGELGKLGDGEFFRVIADRAQIGRASCRERVSSPV